MKRSTSWLVCYVVAAHALAVCLVLLIQGCGTPITPDGRTASGGLSTSDGGSTSRVTPVPEAQRTLPPRASTQRQPLPKPKPVVRRAPAVVPVQKTGDSSEYVVQKGDSLSMIAMRFNVKVAEIMALNQIKKADTIQVGQKLLLPGKVNLAAPKPTVKATPKVTVATSGEKHVVKPGETLGQIAVDYGIKVADLQKANGITGHVIYVGQSLVVPGATKKPAAVASSEAPKKPEVLEQPVVKKDDVPADAVVTPPVVDVPKPPVAGGTTTEAGSADLPLTMHTHEVKDGEDLYSVSLIWDVSIDELKRINNLSGTDLTPGQVLRIPRVE